MGFVDNTLQRESTKVVIMSNCSSFQGKSGILPMENDHRDARGGQPKYKQRSVSAVRDFPPGCGRHVPRIFLEPKDEAVCISVVENLGDIVRNSDAKGDGLITSRSGIDSEPPKALENLGAAIIPGHMNLGSTVIRRQSDHLESEVEELVAPSERENGITVKIEPVEVPFPGVPDSLSNAGDIEQLKSSEHETVNEPNILHKKDVPASRVHIFSPKNPPRRKISAVRDFPPFCGRNAAPFVHGNTNAAPQNGDDNLTKVGDTIHNEHNHKSQMETQVSTKDRRNQDKFGAYSENETKMIRPHFLEQSIKHRQERIQDQRELKAHACLESGKRSIKVLDDIEGLDIASNRPIVFGLAAAGTGPSMMVKNPHKANQLSGRTSESKQTKSLILQEHPKASLKANKYDVGNNGGVRIKEKKEKDSFSSARADKIMEDIALDVEDKRADVGESDNLPLVRRSQNLDATLPPCPIRSSGKSDGNDVCVARSQVKETLRLYHSVYRKVVKEAETTSKYIKRPDCVAANILKDHGKFINLDKIIGPVPGIEVGDEYQYRSEIHIIGLHRPMQAGIDYAKEKGGRVIAISIVASGGYDDNMEYSDVLIYTGSGGNVMDGKKEPEDQKLERGNLALKNSVDAKNPVRVIRGDMIESESSSVKSRMYVYDGLYLVEECRQGPGPHGKRIFKFKLVRLPGQPELDWKAIKKRKSSNIRGPLYG